MALHVVVAILLLAALCSCAATPAESAARLTPTKKGHAPVNGLQLYYEVYGQGPPILLLHGGGSSIHVTWGQVIPLLARSRTVIAMDEQGHGRTRKGDGAIDRPFTFENSADDAAALLDYLKIAKADVMGFSNGGSVALRVAQRHPAKVRKLIPISCQYRRDGMMPGFWDGFAGAKLEMMPKPLRDYDLAMNGPEHLQAMFDQDLKRMSSFQDWPDSDLTSIKAPTLVVVGDQDVVTTDHAMKMSKLMPGARLLVVPGNHGDFLGQLEVRQQDSPRPAAVMQLIEAFLNE